MMQVQPVELVLPGRPHTPPSPGNSWWIVGLVIAVLLINAILIWCRLKGRDPLGRAFARVSARLGLSRSERARIHVLAGDETPPVALLLSESVLDRAAAADPDDPLVVSIRHKVRSASA